MLKYTLKRRVNQALGFGMGYFCPLVPIVIITIELVNEMKKFDEQMEQLEKELDKYDYDVKEFFDAE